MDQVADVKITDMKERYRAGVLRCRQIGYWEPDYEPEDTDILAVFHISPQEGVDPEEAGAAVAGESSTATWTVVWTDCLTDSEHYRANAYKAEPVPGRPDQWFAYIVYDLNLFEEGLITNLTASIIGNVFGFKPLKALRLKNLRVSSHYLKTFQGPATGIFVERERLSCFGRPLPGTTLKPSLGLSGRNYGRVVSESLKDVAKWCRPVRAILNTRNHVIFNYASTDTVDFVPMLTCLNRTAGECHGNYPGTISFLPSPNEPEINKQIEYALNNGCAVGIECTSDPHPRNCYRSMFGNPMFSLRGPASVKVELETCKRKIRALTGRCWRSIPKKVGKAYA